MIRCGQYESRDVDVLQRYDVIGGQVNHSFDVESVEWGVNCLSLEFAIPSRSVWNFNGQNVFANETFKKVFGFIQLVVERGGWEVVVDQPYS